MKKILFFLFPIPFLLLYSCESVIEPDLKDAPPQLVIEGTVTNEDTTHTVMLSMSTSFTANSEFVGVEGATVEITDLTDNQIQTLTMTEPGIYQTTKFAGVSGHTYVLRVVVDGKEYTAKSTMPSFVQVDTIYEQKTAFGGQTITTLIAEHTDPTDEKNFYRAKLYLNSEPKKPLYFTNDTYENGQVMHSPFFTHDAVAGDTIDIDFMNTDENTYTYFYTLGNALDANSAAPANPTSNITGGCLGYFSAQTLERKRHIMQ